MYLNDLIVVRLINDLGHMYCHQCQFCYTNECFCGFPTQSRSLNFEWWRVSLSDLINIIWEFSDLVNIIRELSDLIDIIWEFEWSGRYHQRVWVIWSISSESLVTWSISSESLVTWSISLESLSDLINIIREFSDLVNIREFSDLVWSISSESFVT